MIVKIFKNDQEIGFAKNAESTSHNTYSDKVEVNTIYGLHIDMNLISEEDETALFEEGNFIFEARCYDYEENEFYVKYKTSIIYPIDIDSCKMIDSHLVIDSHIVSRKVTPIPMESIYDGVIDYFSNTTITNDTFTITNTTGSSTGDFLTTLYYDPNSGEWNVGDC